MSPKAISIRVQLGKKKKMATSNFCQIEQNTKSDSVMETAGFRPILYFIKTTGIFPWTKSFGWDDSVGLY